MGVRAATGLEGSDLEVRLQVVGGTDSFLSYGLVNDGKDATSGTNDGSYVAMEGVKTPPQGGRQP